MFDRICCFISWHSLLSEFMLSREQSEAAILAESYYLRKAGDMVGPPANV